jgi:hypothetical protein
VQGDMKEAVKNHIVEYIVKLEGVYGREVDVPVFVASDSASTIPEIKQWRPHWTIWNIEDIELKTEKGFSTVEFMKQPREWRLRWMRLLLAEFEMLRMARYTHSHREISRSSMPSLSSPLFSHPSSFPYPKKDLLSEVW